MPPDNRKTAFLLPPDTSGSDSTPVSITTTESWDFSTGFYPAMSPATSNGTYGFTYYARKDVYKRQVAATLEYVQGISVVKSFNMCDKNLSDIEDAYESNA